MADAQIAALAEAWAGTREGVLLHLQYGTPLVLGAPRPAPHPRPDWARARRAEAAGHWTSTFSGTGGWMRQAFTGRP